MNYRFEMKLAAVVVCATVAAACEGSMQSPVSPSAASGGGIAALNADGSNLKVDSPLAVAPLFEQTGVSPNPTLSARASFGKYVSNSTSFGLSHRFQVADTDGFENIVASGTGTTDSAGVTRWTVDTALTANKRYVWRVRAESGDSFGPWSNVMAFTTATGTASSGGGGSSPSTPSTGTGPRTPDPVGGARLPLPDMRGVLANFADASESCPRGLKYVNNPWQDRVIDAFRQVDSRWGYNGKPTRSAGDNNGVPVVAAGDEAAYHYSAGPDQGSPEVHLVDLLEGHCGTAPRLTWRVFTGEEPGFWTGAGRF